ncbi:hypothetical protein Q0L23_29680 (plasmid) [Klebsiella michiganensis]|uniref:hypothetical protein n=1 Tax=Klebsiella michiganensis TaxID=1134687 RepID=UPI00265876D6|nr:hypothetical protein [Klebsiella michiganensis]WKJ95780.1 hypothetical protein Q0L46_16590 [Klebsiella michiganensis]WKK00957.1 hypothetical protein Q0L46_29315 [Klebsiella michiganensis]WKK02874.1 hypothetical protein Q0L23_23710 [Klebsiella michiganensis]WKK07004.1 hypothetical protein Q0L23_29680 [Klebsiella michiganensis]
MNNINGLMKELSSKGTDFTASTYAFLERFDRDVSSIDIEKIVSEDELPFFHERLRHYREIYKKRD